MSAINLPDSIKAAHATLLALAAVSGLDSSRTEIRYRIGPDATLLEREGAAQLLSTIPKPVSCTASREGSSAIAILCRTLTSTLELARHRKNVLEQALVPVISRVFGLSDNSRRIALMGGGGTVLMNASEIQGWLDDYDFEPVGLGFVFDDPDPTLRLSGVVGIINLKGPGTYSKLEVRPD